MRQNQHTTTWNTIMPCARCCDLWVYAVGGASSSIQNKNKRTIRNSSDDEELKKRVRDPWMDIYTNRKPLDVISLHSFRTIFLARHISIWKLNTIRAWQRWWRCLHISLPPIVFLLRAEFAGTQFTRVAHKTQPLVFVAEFSSVGAKWNEFGN